MSPALFAVGAVAIALLRSGRTRRMPTPHDATGDEAGRHTDAVKGLDTDRPPSGWRQPAVSVAIVIVAGAAEPMLGVALVLMLAGWPRLRRLRADQARLRREAAALPDAIELFVMAVQAGMTAHQAVELVATRAPGPIRPALAEVRRRVERGQQLSDALSALPDLLGPHAAGIADVVSMSERYGTPMAQSLELLARDVAEQRRRRSEAAARTLPVRMSFPLVVCTLPSFVLIAVVPALLAAVGSLGDSAW